MTVKYIQLRTGIRWTTFVLFALSTTPASPRWRHLRRTSCTWAGRWRRDCDLLVKIYCFSVVGSLILVIIFPSWLRKLGLNEGKVQRLHSHVGDSIHQVQSKICAVQWEPHKIREKICFSFIFSPRWHRGCFQNCQSRSPQGWKSFMTLTWRCLDTSLTRLFEIVPFSCEVFHFLWYLWYLIFLWYLWYPIFLASGNSQCFFWKPQSFEYCVYCHISYIVYMLYCILCI